MSVILGVLNFFKARFRWLLLATSLVLSALVVQYVGSYSTWFYKYLLASGLMLLLLMGWYWLEQKLSKTGASANERSLLWIVIFLLIIPIGLVKVVQKEWNYIYHIPLCDCTQTMTKKDRAGAICKDQTKSYATGRGTCSEHDGVAKWQCTCP